MEAELLPQDLEIAGLRLAHVEPEEVTAVDELAHPGTLEVEPPVGAAMDHVSPGPDGTCSELTGRWYAGGRRPPARRSRRIGLAAGR